MKALRILAVVVVIIVMLAAPFAMRTAWYYQGTYRRTSPVATPGFTSLEYSQLPLSTPIPLITNASAEKKVVVIDFEHGNSYSLTEIENFTRAIVERGAKLEVSAYEVPLSTRLKYADAYVVINPTIEFTRTDIQEINDFVQRGGKLLVLADPTRNTNPYYYYSSSSQPILPLSGSEICNLLLKPYGIRFNDDYVYNIVTNEGNFRNVIFNQIASSPITENVSRVVLYGAHSLKVEGNSNSLISGDANTLSSLTDKGKDLPVAVASGDGNVLALGDISFLANPYNQVADNQVLIQNLARFLVGGNRKVDLSEFPYIFSRPLTILTNPDTLIDKDFLASLSGAQNVFQGLNLSIQLSDKPIEGNDLVVFSTMPPTKQVEEDYLKPFNLQFSKELRPTPTAISGYGGGYGTPTPTPYVTLSSAALMQDVVTIPGFGKFAVNDLALVLFTPGEQRDTLILMAADSQSLNSFTYNILVVGNLTNCMVKENIAVCKATPSSTNSGYGSG